MLLCHFLGEKMFSLSLMECPLRCCTTWHSIVSVFTSLHLFICDWSVWWSCWVVPMSLSDPMSQCFGHQAGSPWCSSGARLIIWPISSWWHITLISCLYFDLFVRSTTQSVVISSISSQTGVAAAAAGEVIKDIKYQDIVNNSGGNFIPLICETFGIWTPFALSILGSIVDRTFRYGRFAL